MSNNNKQKNNMNVRNSEGTKNQNQINNDRKDCNSVSSKIDREKNKLNIQSSIKKDNSIDRTYDNENKNNIVNNNINNNVTEINNKKLNDDKLLDQEVPITDPSQKNEENIKYSEIQNQNPIISNGGPQNQVEINSININNQNENEKKNAHLDNKIGENNDIKIIEEQKEIEVKNPFENFLSLLLKFEPNEHDNIDNIDNININNINSSGQNEKPFIYYSTRLKITSSKPNSNSPISTENDFDKILKHQTFNNISRANLLLCLNEREWIEESINLSNHFKSKRECMEDYPFKTYLKALLSQHNHFNWIVYSLGLFYSHSLYICDNEFNENFLNKSKLPKATSIDWLKGFEWKGLYIKVQSYEESKKLINEIKGLNYVFFDYIQLLDNCKDRYISNKNDENPYLSNEIIFPLISYCYVNGVVLFATCTIEENSNSIVNQGNDDYYKDYSVDDCSESKILSMINKNNLFPLFSYVNKIKKTKNQNSISSNRYHNNAKLKYLIHNSFDLIPNLFDIKDIEAKENNIFKDIRYNYFYYIANSNSPIKSSFNKNYFSFFPKKSKNEQNIYYEHFTSLIKTVFKTDDPSLLKSHIITKDGIEMKIIYTDSDIPQNNFKIKKNFIYYLINNSIYQNEKLATFSASNKINNINLPVLVLYRLTEATKLKYSLIREINNKSNRDVFLKNYHYKSNFFNYLNMWCRMQCTNNYDINSVSSLKENMHRYGLNMGLSIFILVNVMNYNDKLSVLIKIYILVSILQKTIDNNEGVNLFSKLTLHNHMNVNNLNSTVDYMKIDFNFLASCNNLSEIRRKKIFYLILVILYPHIIKEQGNSEYTEYIMSEILLYLNIKSLKWRIIDDFMALSFFSNQYISDYFAPKKFIKELISTARKVPFLFLTSLESKLHFSINPYSKFKASLSLESMYNKLQESDIILDSPSVYSYINPNEISGYILTQQISNIGKMNMFINSDEKMKTENVIRPSCMIPKIHLNQDRNEDACSENANINNVTRISHKINESFVKGDHIEENNNIINTNMNTILNYNNQIVKQNLNNMNNITVENLNNFKRTKKKNFSNNVVNNMYISGNPFTWKELSDDFAIILPAILYKQKYKYEEYSNKINFQSIYKNLSNNYQIKHYDVIKNWNKDIDLIYNGIISPNYTYEREIIKVYMYEFFNNFYIEKNTETSNKILQNIKEVFSMKNNIQVNYEYLSIIGLFEGLLETDYLKSEEFYSKALILSLFAYGDARGRFNDGHGFVMYPLWKIARKCNFLDHVVVENFKELFHSQNYYYKIGRYQKNENKDLKYQPYIDYSKNQQKNKDNTFTAKKTTIDNENYLLTESVNFLNEDIDERPNDSYIQNNIEKYSKLSEINFNSDLCDLYVAKPFQFPQISDRDKNNVASFETREFAIFMLKQIGLFISSFNSNFITLDEIEYFGIMNLSCLEKINMCDIDKKSDKESLNNTNNNIKKGKRQILSHFVYDELLKKLSYKENLPNRVLISFGNNKNCETTHDECEMLSIPRIAYKLKNINICKLSCGWDHNIIIDKIGQIYSWGHNQSSQCGVDNHKGKDNLIVKTVINLSQKNEAISKLTFVQTACGNEHTLALTSDGDVYGFGSNCDGVLGLNDPSIQTDKFTYINFPTSKKKVKIVSISCGTVHNLALSEEGKIYTWGSAQGGQLGLSEDYLTQIPDFEKNLFISQPTLVQRIGKKIIKISTGEAHCMVLTENYRCFTWGFGSNGQLGLGFCEDSFEPGSGMSKSRILEPLLVHKMTADVIDIQCGKTFTMFITKNKELYACGVNDLYQLGVSEPPNLDHLFRKDLTCFDYVYPTKVEHFLTMKVDKIACGEGHCLAIIRDAVTNLPNVWSWGNNKYGQLGLGAQLKTSLPKPIGWLFGTNDFFSVKSICCGGFHSLCLLVKNNKVDWIDEDLFNIIFKVIDGLEID